MCQFISFFHNVNNGDIRVFNIESHWITEKYFNMTGDKNWCEGHYFPDGQLDLRAEDKKTQIKCEDRFKNRFKNFASFFNWCMEKLCKDGRYEGNIDLNGCDLQGVKLPTEISENLDVSRCDLRGVELPKKIGGWLDVSGSDLRGVKLPTKIKCSLIANDCDLRGVKLPRKIGGWLDVSRCDLTDVKLPKNVKILK